MKFLTRWAFRLVVVALVLVIGLILLKDTFLKALLESQIRARTGMDVSIGKLELGLFSPTLSVREFKLFNPPEYGGSPFVDLPELYLQWDTRALARRELHLRLLRVSLAELNIVESADGRTNLVLGIDSGTRPAAGSPVLYGFTFGGIDALNLTAGRVRFTSLRHPGQTAESDLHLDHQVFTGLRSAADWNGLATSLLFRNGITIVSKPARAQSSPRRNQR